MKKLLLSLAFLSAGAQAQFSIGPSTPDYDSPSSTLVPTSITLEGKNSWSYWQTLRTVKFSNGVVLQDRFRNNTNNPSAAMGHFVQSTAKPAWASTQWISYTLTVSNPAYNNYVDHLPVIGRATMTGTIPDYHGRGLAMWPNPSFVVGGGNPCTSPNPFRHIRQEYFSSAGARKGDSVVDPNCINTAFQHNVPLKIVMHVTTQASAAWVYSATTGRLIGSTAWVTPTDNHNYFPSEGTGLIFAALCNDGPQVDGRCVYKETRSPANTPFKIEFNDIQTGWF